MTVIKHVADKPGYAVPHEKSRSAAHRKRDEREQNIAHHHTHGAVSESFKTGDLSAFFVHKTHHRRQNDEQRYRDENYHQNVAYAADFIRGGNNGFETVIVVKG